MGTTGFFRLCSVRQAFLDSAQPAGLAVLFAFSSKTLGEWSEPKCSIPNTGLLKSWKWFALLFFSVEKRTELGATTGATGSPYKHHMFTQGCLSYFQWERGDQLGQKSSLSFSPPPSLSHTHFHTLLISFSILLYLSVSVSLTIRMISPPQLLSLQNL